MQGTKYKKYSPHQHNAKQSKILASLLVIIVISIFLLPAFYLQHFFNVSRYRNNLRQNNKESHSWSFEKNPNLNSVNAPKIQGLPPPPKPDYAQCKLLNDSEKYDCYPEDGANAGGCEARGCCWVPRQTKKNLQVKLDVPYCFYPPNYDSYTYVNVTATAYGLTAFLRRKFQSPYPKNVETIKMDVRFETSTRLHVKVKNDCITGMTMLFGLSL